MDRAISCCITGHRPEKLPWGERENDPRCLALKVRIRTELERAYQRGIRHFLTGMARGTDLYFGEEVLALRKQHPDITLEAAVPFIGQADRWRREEKARYQALLNQCDYETVIRHSYDRSCMRQRNRYLVDHASLVLAVYNGKGGGTLYTMTYAMEQGAEVIILEV